MYLIVGQGLRRVVKVEGGLVGVDLVEVHRVPFPVRHENVKLQATGLERLGPRDVRPEQRQKLVHAVLSHAIFDHYRLFGHFPATEPFVRSPYSRPLDWLNVFSIG